MAQYTTTVLMISHEASYTGAPLFLERLARGLANSDYRVVIFFSKDGPVAHSLVAEGFEVYLSNKRPTNRQRWSVLAYRLSHYFRFLKTLCLVKPDVVYSSTISNCGEVLLSRFCGYKLLLHMHEGNAFAKRLKLRLTLQAAACSGIVVGSKYAAEVLLSLTGKVGDVLPIGVDIVPFSIDITKQPSPMMRFGILGTLEKNKGQMLALEALAKVVSKGLNVQLVIAGAEVDEAYSFKLKNFVSDNGLESRVIFLGKVRHVDSFYRAIDVLLVCSYEEVFPTVILEAMREKKLVVATRVGGIPEIIENNETGFLYDAGNEQQLSELMINIFQNLDCLSKIINNANSKFEKNYGMDVSLAAVSRRLEQIRPR